MALAEELRGSLQGFLASGTFELRESGSRTTLTAPVSWEVRGAGEKPPLHLWGQHCNVTRRVIAITEQSEERVGLAVEKFGRAQPQKMDLVRIPFERSAKELSREGFCDQLRRILAEQFPDETVEKLSIAADLEHSLSGIYARGTSRKGSLRCAFLAVTAGETPNAIESSLTYALLWLERARQSGKSPVSFLRLILPAGTASMLTNRLSALHPRLAIQVYELNPVDEQVARVDPCSDGNVHRWVVAHRGSELLKTRASEALGPIAALAPEAITVHANPQEQEVVLRFRGLLSYLHPEMEVIRVGVAENWRRGLRVVLRR
jgi:hypothetical protein